MVAPTGDRPARPASALAAACPSAAIKRLRIASFDWWGNSTHAFNPEATDSLCVAFDRVCSTIAERDRSEFVKELIARRVVALAERGGGRFGITRLAADLLDERHASPWVDIVPWSTCPWPATASGWSMGASPIAWLSSATSGSVGDTSGASLSASAGA
jgi:hypothetical protein